jgi:probable rRNA maturation factor
MCEDGPVDVVIEDERWERWGLAALAEAAVLATLRQAGLDPSRHEVAVLGCDDARIAGLNEAFRGKAAPTNVLAWPTLERDPGETPQPGALGDVALAFDTCRAEASEQGKPMSEHATHLLVHATLHLLGHDHDEDDTARLMETQEVAILASLGLPDPYVPRDGKGGDVPAGRQKAPTHDRPSEASA